LLGLPENQDRNDEEKCCHGFGGPSWFKGTKNGLHPNRHTNGAQTSPHPAGIGAFIGHRSAIFRHICAVLGCLFFCHTGQLSRALARNAKTLKTSYEAGDLNARARLRQHPPRAGDDLKHADFLHVIARENSFAAWPAMKEAVQSLGLDRAAKVQRLKIALHNGKTGIVQRLMQDTPDLAAGHFGLLCALYDVRAVWTMLSNDPALAVTPAGPSLPMVHLARSKMHVVWAEKAQDAVAIADMLVANGADVNAGSVEHGAPLSPLYWALGHAGHIALARWLLEAGADPNDGESLYHATELGHLDGLRLLLEHGANPKGTNALPRAMDFDDADMVALLLDAGADPNEGSDGADITAGVPVLHQAARRMNSGAVLDLLLDHGANPTALWKFGGTLFSTILHGSENNPNRASRDYVACLRLALEHGVALPKPAINAVEDSDVRAFLQQWAHDRPGQVVSHGTV